MRLHITYYAIGMAQCMKHSMRNYSTVFHKSLHIELYEFNGNIITSWSAISADPQFNVISCCIGQALCKPWRVVELTACAGGCTVPTIPENIIGKEYVVVGPR